MSCKHYRYQREVVGLVGGCELGLFGGFHMVTCLQDVSDCPKFESMSRRWRPEKGWLQERNIFFEQNQSLRPYGKTREKDYEAGADGMLRALFQLAKESPTGTFTLDSKVVNVFKGDNNVRV